MSVLPIQSPSPPEHWCVDAGSDSVAVLNIPGLVGHTRVFDVDITLMVNVPLELAGAWLELTVEFDGQLHWSRRIQASNPGQTDGLEHHRRLRLMAEQGLRVRAMAKVNGVRIRLLLVEAQEQEGR